MQLTYRRRDVLKRTGGAFLGITFSECLAADGKPRGAVVGQPQAAEAGAEVLASGGNAIDAAVTAALVAGVIAPHQCGPGGYGGHLVIALAGGKKVTAIDFNTTAPRAAREDLFPLDAAGKVKGLVNEHGWLAAGVPGTLAGLQRRTQRDSGRQMPGGTGGGAEKSRLRRHPRRLRARQCRVF